MATGTTTKFRGSTPGNMTTTRRASKTAVRDMDRVKTTGRKRAASSPAAVRTTRSGRATQATSVRVQGTRRSG